MTSAVTPNVSYDDSDYANAPDYTPVVPDTSSLDLPGQFDSLPGGSSANGGYLTSDGSGMNVIYSDPTVNPTPTGGWMQVAASVASAAQQGMRAYSSGTPTPAIPPIRMPVQSPSLFTTAQGGTNWPVIGLVVAAGIAGMFALGIWG